MFGFGKRGEAETEAPTETKASAAGRVMAWGGAGRVAWSPRDTVSLTRAGFLGNPVGFRAVRLIAEAAAALPLVMQDAEQRYEVHPLLELLARPNGVQGRAELLEALYGQILLSGNGYVEAVGAAATETGLPIELHVLRSDRMSLVPGQDGWPVAYEYNVGGRKHRFSVGDGVTPVCHIRSFHPQDDHYGFSPIQAAASAIDVHNAASRWSKALLDNAARPSGAIVYRGADGQASMSADQYDRLLSEMETQHQGARNAGRPMLLEGGLDWKPMGFSPSDMEFQKTKEAAAREIALAFGVPPMLLGIPGDATYANYQEANRAFYRLTVLPLASRVVSALADWLSDFQGLRFTLKPDLDQVPALAQERDAQWRRVSDAVFLSIAEKRAILGLPARQDDTDDA
ncbi:phage portal protein [Ponticoccus sp. SC2-23]|uniref:phage portal protein n=1 Tax=Alexandriicola marinus TaxID=2081710 RepID=UPI000FDB6172|nr:phage portal protein [Alexandriicola marinus]MBM1222574.1 phage portal protein [Ponticoccus sp. SC6-9]MBM1227079.1 phage portal protein [Ponticoccus sp. SC6-15]MBM1231500.1 phage portal protein [Ponticoccus sp. SC6-38]MBM1236064.1 phage portal protein [Ponticoccus sp. SC6-45]MBM1240523.1 phage portal protein [Ponticoccus sp. SC6-49]MBM1245058.1 phage portal protein [Ponticoccus sp. SC2-64]MBM1249538.1 phage portal protein [Ponticoccus sp. SC6-42]MBM1254016.1 phage portal protein [Pontico